MLMKANKFETAAQELLVCPVPPLYYTESAQQGTLSALAYTQIHNPLMAYKRWQVARIPMC